MKITFIPLSASEKELIQAALLSCVSDLSAESEAIFQRSVEITGNITLPRNSNLIYTSTLSGVDLKDRKIRKGALIPIEKWRGTAEGLSHEATLRVIEEVENRGNKALVIADEAHDLGVIELAL
jgi:K+-transporting ATPase ATPase B chain